MTIITIIGITLIMLGIIIFTISKMDEDL